MPEATIANIRIRTLLEKRGGIKDGDCYIMPNLSVVRMPEGHRRFSIEHAMEIAFIKCDMEAWEFDYWLAHQDVDAKRNGVINRRERRRGQ